MPCNALPCAAVSRAAVATPHAFGRGCLFLVSGGLQAVGDKQATAGGTIGDTWAQGIDPNGWIDGSTQRGGRRSGVSASASGRTGWERAL